MKARGIVQRVVAILALAVLALAAVQLLVKDDPSFGGHRLSYWLRQSIASHRSPFGLRLTQDAANAVRALGTNAIPPLLTRMRSPYSAGGRRAAALEWLGAHRLAELSTFLWPKSYQPINGVLGFEALRSRGAPAIPALVQMLSNPEDRAFAEKALVAIGPEGMEALRQVLRTNSNQVLRANVLLSLPITPVLSRDNSLAQLVATPLIEDLDPMVRTSAAQVLGAFTNLPDVAIPALARAVSDKDGAVRSAAADALLRFPAARLPGAVPAVIRTDGPGETSNRSPDR